MKKVNLLLMTTLLLAACQKEAVTPATNNAEVKANWSSSAQWATWSNGGYTLYNNIWGSGAGPQVIWANTYSNWGVWANHPNTGGIKSYPNSERVVNRQLSTLASLGSSFNVTRPGSGSYVSAYDIWDTNFDYEIMLWMNRAGGVKPISYNWDANGNPVPLFSNLSLGGHTWNVYRGNNTANEVFSFVRTSNTNAGTVDIRAILNWIRNRGWMGNITVGKVQFGFEITSSSGGMDFICNSYSVSYN
ncbi:GH12 family glycosyl hydrolase domain-containing protein [Chitinophaga japonensis]|uniref:Glycosyl hydrolase family 12 n=1 Tax=Chitinophaga japonensis TaxID=104662 RepID=A0A562SM61_CHIJA|nr:glycosyl hydrolase [Chitinophaga japonensis]TWI82014.1 glycosyl hydrolase family 12 [Chitinophaga japonensis]